MQRVIHKTTTTILTTLVAAGLLSVPAGAARSPQSPCIVSRASAVVPALEYEVFPDNLDATMQSLQAAIYPRDVQPRLAAAQHTPLRYDVVPDNLDATIQSLQGAITARELARSTGTTVRAAC